MSLPLKMDAWEGKSPGLNHDNEGDTTPHLRERTGGDVVSTELSHNVARVVIGLPPWTTLAIVALNFNITGIVAT
jgi:hypothetical protein